MTRAIILVLAAAALAGCASTISPNRQDFIIVDGRLSASRAYRDCGTVQRPSGGYFYVCDMSIDVSRVVFGTYPHNSIVARFFFLELDNEDEIITGPHFYETGRAAAILWQSEDGPRSFVLVEFPGRWCMPDWMTTEFSVTVEEIAQLRRAGYPLCSVDNSTE